MRHQVSGVSRWVPRNIQFPQGTPSGLYPVISVTYPPLADSSESLAPSVPDHLQISCARCTMSQTFTVAALWDSLSEDTYFLSPLSRKFTHLEKALVSFVEGKQVALGGLVSTETTERQRKRQLKELTQITVSWLRHTAAKDTTVRAAMIQNVVTAQLARRCRPWRRHGALGLAPPALQGQMGRRTAG